MALGLETVCLQLFLSWLQEEMGQTFKLEEGPGPPFVAGDGQRILAIDIQRLLPPSVDDSWRAACEWLKGECEVGLTGAYALWLPPGAVVPSPESEAGGELVRRIRRAASALAPGERSQVELPVTLYLRKLQAEGALVSVAGPLERYWTTLSAGVPGAFDLDATQLCRLPEEAAREELIERVKKAAHGIMDIGSWLDIETVDLWTLQRLEEVEEGDGMVVVGLPPAELKESGAALRRNLRRSLAEANERLTVTAADLRALVLIGIFAHMEEETATIALRGNDPKLYAGLDHICLAADGRIKPLVNRASAQGRA